MAVATWTPSDVRPGDALIATDAFGDDHECIADSGYEGTHTRIGRVQVHDFPVIWVRFTTKGDRLPWPVENLRSCG